MFVSPAAPSDRPSLNSGLIGAAVQHVRGDATAIMIYGSRARGTARIDSDVDILALVNDRSGTYQSGEISISYYTPDHLSFMTNAGSLFLQHLRDEGIILWDNDGTLRKILNSYRQPKNFTQLRHDIAVVLEALGAPDAPYFSDGLCRAAVWAARSAVYVVGAEKGILHFDTATACERAGVPELAAVIKSRSAADLSQLKKLGLKALGVDKQRAAGDLVSMALLAWESNPLAARVLESVISGASQLEYTQLTLQIA